MRTIFVGEVVHAPTGGVKCRAWSFDRDEARAWAAAKADSQAYGVKCLSRVTVIAPCSAPERGVPLPANDDDASGWMP